MQKGHTESFRFPSVDGPKLFQAKVVIFVLGFSIKPVFDNKIGVFIDLGLKQKCQDDDEIVRGFPLHILRATRTSMEKSFNGCNVKEQLFAHLFGSFILLHHVVNHLRRFR